MLEASSLEGNFVKYRPYSQSYGRCIIFFEKITEKFSNAKTPMYTCFIQTEYHVNIIVYWD